MLYLTDADLIMLVISTAMLIVCVGWSLYLIATIDLGD